MRFVGRLQSAFPVWQEGIALQTYVQRLIQVNSVTLHRTLTPACLQRYVNVVIQRKQRTNSAI
jgi:hypothetical protein